MASGRGTPVVLVHGALGDYRQWDGIVSRLKSRHRTVALSRRCHWPNSPPDGRVAYSVESHRDDLLALLRSIGEPVHLAGHSYGALVVLSAALGEPALLRSLILIEPPLSGLLPAAAKGLDAELTSRASMLAAMRAQIAAGDDEAASVTLIDWVQERVGGFAALPESACAQLLANAATIGPTYATAPQNITCAHLRTLRIPVLVLNGALSRPFYRFAASAATACMSGALTAEIPQSGHMAIVESPAATAALMLEFMAAL